MHERLIPLSLELPLCVRVLLGTEEEIEIVKADSVTEGDDGVDVVNSGNSAKTVEKAVEVRLGEKEGAETRDKVSRLLPVCLRSTKKIINAGK